MANKSDVIATGGAGDGGADIGYELVVDTDEGSAALTCGGEVLWSSENDPDYTEEWADSFIEIDDDDQLDELIDWLVTKGYVPPGVEYDVVDLAESMDLLDGER
jgi:hypothetical protein